MTRQRLNLRNVVAIAICLAVTAIFISCNKPDDGDNGDNNGGNNVEVSGKRLKSYTQTGGVDGTIITDITYNADGTVKLENQYVESKHTWDATYTHNSDGTPAKREQVNVDTKKTELTMVFSYSNKVLQKIDGTIYDNGTVASTYTDKITWQNGRVKSHIMEMYALGMTISTMQYDTNYDNNGRKTTTTIKVTFFGGATSTYTATYTYNADGTVQKVVRPDYSGNGRTITESYTWEDGETTGYYELWWIL